MIDQILTAADIPYKAARFPDPPADTYAVFFDEVAADGSDPFTGADAPYILHHDIMVELYEPTQDDAAEARLEAQLNALALSWTKQARYWLKDVQRYQVIYEFSYTTKS